MSTEILDSYEDLVSRLVRNKVDNIEIIAHGRCFDLDVSSYNDFTSRRILLLRRVILEICKISDSTTDKYNNSKRRQHIMTTTMTIAVVTSQQL